MMTLAIYTRKCAAINIGESNLLSMVLVLLPKPNGVMHWSCHDSSLVFNLSTFLLFFVEKIISENPWNHITEATCLADEPLPQVK